MLTKKLARSVCPFPCLSSWLVALYFSHGHFPIATVPCFWTVIWDLTLILYTRLHVHVYNNMTS